MAYIKITNIKRYCGNGRGGNRVRKGQNRKRFYVPDEILDNPKKLKNYLNSKYYEQNEKDKIRGYNQKICTSTSKVYEGMNPYHWDLKELEKLKQQLFDDIIQREKMIGNDYWIKHYDYWVVEVTKKIELLKSYILENYKVKID